MPHIEFIVYPACAGREFDAEIKLAIDCGHSFTLRGRTFSSDGRCARIMSDGWTTAEPAALDDINVCCIELTQGFIPCTVALDGTYIDGSITAHVESQIIVDANRQTTHVQHVKIIADGHADEEHQHEITVEQANAWLEGLLAGKHSDKCATPVVYSQGAPVSAEPQPADTSLVARVQGRPE